MSEKSAQDDLAFVRELAEEGRMQPLQGGRYLVMWGLISSLGLTFTGLLVAGAVTLPPLSIMFVWFLLMGGGAFFSAKWGREAAGTTVSESIGNKVERAVWCVGGGFLGLVSVMLFLLPLIFSDRFAGSDIEYYLLFGMMTPLAFGVYAIALAGTAIAARAEWLKRYVVLAFIFAAITLGLVWDIRQFIAAIIGILIVMVVPGFIMLDKNKKR